MLGVGGGAGGGVWKYELRQPLTASDGGWGGVGGVGGMTNN